MAPHGQTNPLPLQVIEEVLNFIRGNLNNIENSWGKHSPQYRSAVQLMDAWLDENVKQLNLEKSDLDELMQKLSLNDSKS
jgi:2-methylcitrate dehydratase PrpD